MHCPRLKHFVRLQANGRIGKCGHMVGAPDFESQEELENSQWLQDTLKKMDSGEWPKECLRCENTEKINNKSIRTDTIDRHKILKNINHEYIVVGGILDNVCNSACQTCNEKLSTRIGSLKKNYTKVDNYDKFWTLSTDRIIELDINGGEPTYSKNYKKLLDNIPGSVKVVRINTNGALYFEKIKDLLKQGIRVILTVSLDGIEKVHDYVRWPVRWTDFEKNLLAYADINHKLFTLNTWTTLSVLNLSVFEDIVNYMRRKEIQHEFALLENPYDLSVKRKNAITMKYKEKFSNSDNRTYKNLSKQICVDRENNSDSLKMFIENNDRARNIKCSDYLNFDPNLL